jgi:hypothetical protein
MRNNWRKQEVYWKRIKEKRCVVGWKGYRERNLKGFERV